MLTCYRRQTDTPSEPYCKSGLLIGKAFQGFLFFSKEKPLISYEISGSGCRKSPTKAGLFRSKEVK